MARGKRKRAAGYVRISALMGRTQGDDLMSDKIQRERIEAWANFKGYEVTFYEDIDRSGRKGKPRPEFARMMDDARSGMFDAVAVYKWSRLGRDARGSLEVLDELDELGVTFVSVEENIDTSTAMGRFVRLMLVGLAEYQSEQIADEWRVTHAHRRRQGVAFRASRPYGFQTDGAVIVGHAAREAEAVRCAFKWYADGATKVQVARRLDAEGFKPRDSERFTASTVDTILRNPTYKAVLRYKNRKTGAVEEHQGGFDAIVPTALFDRVQRELTRRATDPPPRARAGLLSGLLRCSGCGAVMTFERGSAGKKDVYRCPARNRSKVCALQVSVRAEYVDDYVWQAFERTVVGLLAVNGGGGVGAEPIDGKSRTAAAEAQAQRDRAEVLRAKLDALTLMSGKLGSQYERQAALLVTEIDAADAEADALEARVLRRRTVSRGAATAVASLPLEERQAALRDLLADVYVRAAPRKGRGQQAMIAQRVELVWHPDIPEDVHASAAMLRPRHDGKLDVRVSVKVTTTEGLRALTKRKPATRR